MKGNTDLRQTKKLAKILRNANKKHWSLADLLEIISQVEYVNEHKVTLVVGKALCDRWFVALERVEEENRCEIIKTSEELINACFDVIVELHKKQIIN